MLSRRGSGIWDLGFGIWGVEFDFGMAAWQGALPSSIHLSHLIHHTNQTHPPTNMPNAKLSNVHHREPTTIRAPPAYDDELDDDGMTLLQKNGTIVTREDYIPELEGLLQRHEQDMARKRRRVDRVARDEMEAAAQLLRAKIARARGSN